MATLATVVDTSRAVAATASRSAKVAAIAACLGRVPAEEIAIAVAFLSGETRQGKVGVGWAALQAAAREVAARERPPATVETTGRASGAYEVTADGSASLSLAETDARIAAIAATSGTGSAARRGGLLRELLGRASAAERDFLIRLLVGELRQGALEGVMIDAIAGASGLAPAAVRRAAMYAPVGEVACVALAQGAAGLARFGLRLLSPVAPMLAATAADVDEALAAFDEAAFEWKLDGARVQVHKAGDEVRVYTRNLNDVSSAVPEVVEAVASLPGRELVLDGETLALDAAGAPLPFQVTMRRFGRKLDVDAQRRAIPLSVFFFDCLRHDADDLVERPARERHERLAAVLPPGLRVPRCVTGEATVARAFLAGALAAGHEGVMAKDLGAPYEAGRRGSSWLKVKRAHTLDLVVLAAEWGHGRRRGWLSNLHLGARNPEDGTFVMLGKTFKGLTDELLAWQTRELLAREIGRDAGAVHVRPELVVEIAFSDLQASTRYPGGLALRFARVKAYRPDRSAADADTIGTVRAIHAAQVAAERQGGSAKTDEAPG